MAFKLPPRHTNSNPSLVVGRSVTSECIVEAFRHDVDKKRNKLVIAGTQLDNPVIDISWLPAAAETYKISSDPKDYILVDVPLVTVDIPNRNLQAFPYEEVSYFDPLYGQCVYQTFLRKPTHIDHDNKDPKKAKGVNFDVSLKFVPAYNVWKICVLSGFDRTKDPKLVEDILSKKRSTYSMGALVESFLCAVCGAIDTNVKRCDCGPKGTIVKGQLVFQACCGTNFIENSNVGDPADISASSDSMWELT
jgi:hypothetical protein